VIKFLTPNQILFIIVSIEIVPDLLIHINRYFFEFAQSLSDTFVHIYNSVVPIPQEDRVFFILMIFIFGAIPLVLILMFVRTILKLK